MTIKLDGLEVMVEADGEEIFPPWSRWPAIKYRVRITAEDGYVYEGPFWQHEPFYDAKGKRRPGIERDYEGVAWVCLDLMLTALRDPRYGQRGAATEALYDKWPSFGRESKARVAAIIAAAERLAPLLERNRTTIIEGSEQVDWW